MATGKQQIDDGTDVEKKQSRAGPRKGEGGSGAERISATAATDPRAAPILGPKLGSLIYNVSRE